MIIDVNTVSTLRSHTSAVLNMNHEDEEEGESGIEMSISKQRSYGNSEDSSELRGRLRLLIAQAVSRTR